jgi:hypothetical protein
MPFKNIFRNIKKNLLVNKEEIRILYEFRNENLSSIVGNSNSLSDKKDIQKKKQIKEKKEIRLVFLKFSKIQ